MTDKHKKVWRKIVEDCESEKPVNISTKRKRDTIMAVDKAMREGNDEKDSDDEYKITITKKKDGGFHVYSDGIGDIESLGALRFAEKYHWLQLVDKVQDKTREYHSLNQNPATYEK